MKTILPILIATLFIVGGVKAFDMATLEVDSALNQAQVDSKDLTTLDLDLDITRKEVNGDSYDVIFNYTQITATTTDEGFIVEQKTEPLVTRY